MKRYLVPSRILNFNHEAVLNFALENAGESKDPRVQAVRLYYAVRDGIRYNPYGVDLSPEGLSASATLRKGHGWCVPKAILLASCCRAIGIPARLGFADVRNHLSTARMRQNMKTDVFLWHGYASINLADVWVKATPAFNVELCERFRLRPLDFDGCKDAVYHQYDQDGKLHMEYVRYRGEFADVPIDLIAEDFRREYSFLLSAKDADFEGDVRVETP